MRRGRIRRTFTTGIRRTEVLGSRRMRRTVLRSIRAGGCRRFSTAGGNSELFEYDPIDSVVSKQLFVQTGLSPSGVTMRVGVAGNPTYDAAGRTSTLSFPGFNYYLASAGNTGGYGNAVKFQYGYAPGNRVASVTQWASMSQALYYVYRGNSWPHRDSKRSIPHVWSGVHKPIN